MSSYPILPVREAFDLVMAHTPRLPPEEVDALAALGRVLAERVVTPAPMPPFPAASVDGYAVRSSDTMPVRRLVAEVPAGHPSAVEVAAGTAARILTGGALPPGADAVVMQEQVVREDGAIRIDQPVRPGQYVHPVGQDLQAGQEVLAPGTVLGPAEIGLLATIGRTRVAVSRRPRVAVLSTGDELVEPGEASLRPGAIRDSNRYALMAAVLEAGGVPISLGIAHDDEALQRERICAGLAEADVVLTSGGVSVGSRDLIKPIVAELGTVHFGRIALKPGKPLTFATVGDRLFFGLPGFPVSSLVTFEVFVRPALLRMQGRRDYLRPQVEVVLEHDVSQTPDRTEYQRAVVRCENGRLVGRTTGLQVSSRLLSLVGANALLRVPPGNGVIRAGETLPALLLGPPLGREDLP